MNKKFKRLASDEDKVKALAAYLGIDEEDIEVGQDWGYDTEYVTPEGTFTVMTQDEADEAHYNYIDGLIDDMGLEAFSNPQYILENFSDDIDWFENFYREDYEFYASDISHESGYKSVSRLIDECLDAEIINEDELDEDGEYTGDLDLVDELAQYLFESIDDYVEQFKDEFGEEEFCAACKNHCTLDVQAISDYCVECDDYGHSLARWDGETNEYDNYYIFKQNR